MPGVVRNGAGSWYCTDYGFFTSCTIKLSRVRGHFFMVRFLKKKKQILKPLGPWLGVKPNVDQEKWLRNQKWMCWLHFYICSKRAVLRIFCVFDLPFFLPSSLVTMEMFGKILKILKIKVAYVCYASLDVCNEGSSFASPTAKLVGRWRWIM